MPKPAAFAEALLPFDEADISAASIGTGARLPSYITDHRRRLRERFMAGGAAALPDYEMLELVLFRAIPRQDVKPLARRLIDRFVDFNGVISASPARLAETEGVGDAVICELKIIEAAAQRLARGRVMRRQVISSWDALVDYCHTIMARGTVDHVPVYPREVVKRALELNASALILVHNHPSGDPTPSDADILLTGQIGSAAEALGLVLQDHLIIGKSREQSFRASGLL